MVVMTTAIPVRYGNMTVCLVVSLLCRRKGGEFYHGIMFWVSSENKVTAARKCTPTTSCRLQACSIGAFPSFCLISSVMLQGKFDSLFSAQLL